MKPHQLQSTGSLINRIYPASALVINWAVKRLPMGCRRIGFWLLLLTSVQAQPIPNTLPKAGAAFPTSLRVDYLVDTTDRLTIKQVSTLQVGWQTAADPNLIVGFTTHPVWCRFTLQQTADTARSYALELTNFYVDSLTIYQPDLAVGWRMQHAGDWIPFAQRTPKTRYPTSYVSISGKAPQTFYARILSSQHHSYQWRVWDQATYVTNRLPDTDRYITFTLFFVMTLFLLALLVFMHRFVVLRSYSLWGLAVSISALFASGYSSIIFPNSPYWAHTSNYVTVGLLLPALAYYVVQACKLPQHLPRLVWLYAGFGAIGLIYAGLSFFVRHPYITWGLIGTLAIMMGFTLCLLIALFMRGIQPAIWNVLALLLLLPVYTFFYGRNAGFFTGSLNEESLKFAMLLSTVAEPFFVVAMLWQATRDRIRTADNLSLEQSQRENIQALDKLKTDFFTNVSHELRTPVTLLLGPLQTLHSRFPDNELYALMHRNANRLQTLINQLLDLAKLDAHQMRLSPTPGDLAHDLRVWVALFDSLAQSRSVNLTLRQSQASWPACYDADKVEKVLTNLLSNAVKHTPAGGYVEIETQYEESGLTVEVRDTGLGMTPEIVSHVFERFYQGPEASRSDVGTGVGLALTYELIQLMGGTITVRTEPGEGATFRVSLPIRQETNLILLQKGGISRGSSEKVHQDDQNTVLDDNQFTVTDSLYSDGLTFQGDKPLLLLVEDNDDLRIYMRMILAPHYTVLEAVDGQQGLDMALDTLPDLIVTDLMMPRMDGLELCRSLRADPRTDHIPLVMLTAKATVEDRLTGLETGADDYLTKPFLPPELLVRLQNLRRRQATQQAYWQRTLGKLVSDEATHTTDTPEAVEEAVSETPAFLLGLYGILEEHLDNSDFDVDQLADALAMSSRTLNRKLKGLIGMNTREVIRTYRLRRGHELLTQGIQPTQVAYAVGFGSLSSFGRAFKEQYGYAPSAHKE